MMRYKEDREIYGVGERKEEHRNKTVHGNIESETVGVRSELVMLDPRTKHCSPRSEDHDITKLPQIGFKQWIRVE